MSVISIDKKDRNIPVAHVIYGDRDTSVIRLVIDRFSSDIDLSGLGWSIKIVNGENSDVDTFTPEVREKTLEYDWVLPAIVASNPGLCEIELMGVNAETEQVWQSGKRLIRVDDDLDAEPGYDPESLSALQIAVYNTTNRIAEINMQMDGFEGRITEAVNTANTATDTAERAADRVNKVVDDAENAAQEARNVAEELQRKADSGAFNGEKGDPGKDGKTPVKGVDYFDGRDGYTPVKGVDYFDGTPGAKGEKGDPGDKGDPGSDASVTKGNIESALGYVPADVESTATKEALLHKLDKPETAPAVGKVLKIKSVNADGSFVCEWADDEGADALKEVPIATKNSSGGIARFNDSYGIGDGGTWISEAFRGVPVIVPATEGAITNRQAAYRPIIPSTANHMVKATLTDSNKMVLTDTEKASACQTIGAVRNKKLELIHEYVSDGTEHQLSFTASTDGRPLRLEYAIMFIDYSESTGGTQSGDAYIRAYSGSAQIINSYASVSTASSRKYEIAEIFTRYGAWMLDWGYTSGMLYEFTPAQMYRIDRPTLGRTRYMTDEYPYITKVIREVGGDNSKLFPTGVKVRIEGVWAD